MFAVWKANTYTVKYNANGGAGTTADSSHTYGTAKALTANGFTRTSYKFKNWNTKADGSGTSYKDKQSVKNLTTTDGATVTLYAHRDDERIVFLQISMERSTNIDHPDVEERTGDTWIGPFDVF